MNKSLRDDLDTLVALLTGPNGASVMHVVTALRGPDAGRGCFSEAPNQVWAERDKNYHARVARKLKTGAVIRGACYGKRQVGAQRIRHQSYVTLPPEMEWDHYDRHVALAAEVLGLDIRKET